MLNREYLGAAIATIQSDSTGPHLLGPYSSLQAASMIPPAREVLPATIRVALTRVGEDLWAALTVMWRVDWQREMKRAGHLDDVHWMYFLAADVRELHVTLRSYYDVLLLLIKPIVEKPGQVPLNSFRELFQWLERPGNEARFDPELRHELLSARWFRDLRSVRDGLVHRGFQPFVFPQIDRIGFQVDGRNFAGLRHEGIMINENIVDFQLYSAIQVGQAIGLLQRLCMIILERFGFGGYPPQVRAYHPGLGLLERWAQPLQNGADEKEPQV